MTTGHGVLFKAVEKAKKKYNAQEALVYTTHSQNPEKDPLDYNTKINYLQQIGAESYPSINFVKSDAKNILDALKEVEDRAEDVVLVFGGDRVQEFEALINKYNGDLYHFENLTVVSAGARNPNATDVSGMSASKIRDYVRQGDYSNFFKGIDSDNPELIKSLWFDLKKGMSLKESKSFKREAVTFEENRRIFEAESDPVASFQARIEALSQSSGIAIDTGEVAQESGGEDSKPDLKLQPEAEEIHAKYPDEDPATYTGTAGVLFVDSIFGTKRTPDYIGNFYNALTSTYGQDTSLRVVIRQLRSIDENEKQEKLLAIKIAWDSPVSNRWLKESASWNIDFAVEETKDLLEKIKGDRIILATMGGLLTPELLDKTVEDFKAQSEKFGIKKKNFDTKSIIPVLKQNNLIEIGKQVSRFETKAAEEFSKLANPSANTTKKDIEAFQEKFGVDSRIIMNRLEMSYKNKPSSQIDAKAKVKADDIVGDLARDLGVTPLIMLVDKQLDKNATKKAQSEADKEARKSSKDRTEVYQAKGSNLPQQA